MKKLFGTAVLSALLISTSFANSTKGDTTILADSIDIMPINAEIDMTLLDSVSTTSLGENTNIQFYRDGKTPKVYTSLEDLLKNEKNVTSVTDWCNNWFVVWENAAMTMMYCESIYGENWQEAWQRTDSLISVYGDTANYFNKDLFVKLDHNAKLKDSVSKTLSQVSEKKLEKALEKADTLIETTKLSRIAKFAQNERITQLFFIKVMIQDELSSR